MWKEYYVAVLLLLNSVWDWKLREVWLPSVFLSFVLGLLWNFGFHELTAWEFLGGLGVGAGMAFLAVFTKGAVGLGDGWLLCATGVFLGASGNFTLLLTGSILCAGVLSLGLLTGKVHGKDTIPFVPFLFLAQLLRMVLWI